MTSAPTLRSTVLDGALSARFDPVMLALEPDLGDYQQLLLMAKSGSLCQVYSPFGHLQRNAKVAVVGLTPGDHQARVALQAYIQSRRQGHDIEAACTVAKRDASFSGSIRSNLVRILDHAGINQRLDIDSTATLFDADAELAHFTSLLRYPIFSRGSNYSGTPKPADSPFLWPMVTAQFLHEVQQSTIELWIPLGAAVQDAFRKLVFNGLIKEDHVQFDLPHPSGANMGRIKQFLNNKDGTPGITPGKRQPGSANRMTPPLAAATTEISSTSSKPSERPLHGIATKINGRTFISRSVEDQIAVLATSAGYTVDPIATATTKVRRLKTTSLHYPDTIYYSREVGIGKGRLQLLVHPSIGKQLDQLVLDHSEIHAHTNRQDKEKSRLVFSSNYTAFRNKGQSTIKNEHFAWAYQADLNQGLAPLEYFLQQYSKAFSA
jgi:hypothetical protein